MCTGTARRDYAHPVDSTVIKFLDNKVINFTFKRLVDLLADSTYGPVVASGVFVNEKNYPEINELVDECVETLNIKKPYVIISNSITGLNAMTFGSDEEPYIALSPLLVNTLSRWQLRFVIGHECGHIAMGHMLYHTVVSVAAMFATSMPIIGPVVDKVGALPLKAWSRRSEISADRAGLLCCYSNQVAQRTLLQLELPFMDANQVDVDEYVKNSEQYRQGGFVRKLNEFDASHPIIPKRIQALNEFVKSGRYYMLRGLAPTPESYSDEELAQKVEDIVKVL